jgi:hypothetical protein
VCRRVRPGRRGLAAAGTPLYQDIVGECTGERITWDCGKSLFSPDATKKYFERALVFLILHGKIKKTSARSLFYLSDWSGEILFTQSQVMITAS